MLSTVCFLLAGAPGPQEEAASAPAPMPAEESAEDPAEGPAGESTDDPAWWERFFDEEDGYLDLSEWLATDYGFLPVIAPITEPAIGVGLAAGALFFHGRGTETGPGGKAALPSVTAVFGAKTDEGTWAYGLAHRGVWKGDRIRYLGGALRFHAELDFFGLGGPSAVPGVELEFDGWGTFHEVRFRVEDSPFFVGLDYLYGDVDTTLGGGAIPGIGSVELANQAGGSGPLISYDTRDNPFTPNSGIDALFGFRYYDEWLGGDNRFQRWRAKFRKWTETREWLVLGARVDGEHVSGDAPLTQFPFIQLRGVPAFKYVHRTALTTELEPRIDFHERWSAVLFGGLGWVADDFDGLDDADTVYAYGTGLRYLIARQYGLYAGFDVAKSNEDEAFYITVGSAWPR